MPQTPQPPPPLPRAFRLALQFFVTHGPLGGARLLASRLFANLRRQPVERLASPLDLYPRQTPPAIHPFDGLYAVDTSGFRHGEDLGAAPSFTLASAAPFGPTVWNTAYYGIAPSVFDRALALIGSPGPPPAWSGFTFVDLGCGKGRALLLASRHPFRHILGVELDASLVAIAGANLRRFHAPWQLCRSLEALHADATAIDLPLTPILLYLYHPFLAPALRQVLHRLQRSLRHHPRELWLVYINPEAATVLRDFPFLRPVTRTTLPLDPEDALPDRLGSTQERVIIYHVPPPA